MIKIDAHQHFWQYNLQSLPWISDDMPVLQQDYLPPQLQEVMNQRGFDACVAVQAQQSEAESDFLLQLADQYDFIRGVVGWVDLRAYSVGSRLAHFAQHPKFKGVRHIVQDEPEEQFLLDPAFLRGIKMLSQLNLTYDILIYERQLPAALQFAAYLPEVRLVVDHLAKPKIAARELTPWQENIRSLAQYPNVYCKLSGMVTEADWQQWKADDFTAYLDVVLEAFGPERLMIGSDWPVCLLAASYEQVMEIVDRFLEQLSDAERQRVYGQNAIDFYNLNA